jgi:hypothetical protein
VTLADTPVTLADTPVTLADTPVTLADTPVTLHTDCLLANRLQQSLLLLQNLPFHMPSNNISLQATGLDLAVNNYLSFCQQKH